MRTIWSCVVWFDCLWPVWRFLNRFEFCCATIRLFNSLSRVWTCLWAVVPHYQFIIDSHTVRILFSKCHIQLQIKNSSGNLFCPNTPLSVYGLFLSRISRNNCQTGSFGHVFFMTFAKRLKFAQTYCIVYGQSLLYNMLLRKFVWPCIRPSSVRSPMRM